MTVTPVNDAPLAAADAYALDEDQVLTVAAAGVLGNDGDIDGDALSAVLVQGPANGALVLNADGSFSYTPNANFNGSDGFSYRASDGGLDSGVSTVTLTVNPVNDAPDATDDSAATDEDTPITGNVLTGANGGQDTDADGDLLTVTSAGTFASALGASVTLLADGTFTYDPSGSATLQALGAGTSKVDTFGYEIGDGHGGSDTATVSITVGGLAEFGGGGAKILPSLEAGTPLDYYIRFQGVADSEWLELGHFSLGFDTSHQLVGEDWTSGKAVAEDVLSQLGSSATSTLLTQLAFSGKFVSDVEIEAYRLVEGKAQLVEEFVFDNVVITGVDTSGDTAAIGNDVSFGFRSFEHAHVDYKADGTAEAAVGTQWDFFHNSGGSSGSVSPDAIKAIPQDQVGNGPLDFYVRFDDAGESGWLRLESFSMGVASTADPAAGGGGGAGHASADPVTLGLGASDTLVALTGKLFTGQELNNIEVEVYRPGDGGKAELVDEFVFEDVVLGSLDSQNVVDNLLTFDYAKFSHGHVDYDTDGLIEDTTVAGWDVLANIPWNGPTPDADVLF